MAFSAGDLEILHLIPPSPPFPKGGTGMRAIDFSSNLGYLNSRARWISLIQWVFGCGLSVETY
jgi:hypothetical protein